MLPKLTENKQEITAKSLETAGHALLLLPVTKSLPEVPGSAELKAAMKRRGLKTDALAKSPVAVQLPGGTLAVYAMLKADASTFEAHEQVRRALTLLLAEHPKALTLAVFGEAEFTARAAEAAVYTALVNAVPLPSRKSKADPVLKSVQLFGHKSADGFARVQGAGRRQRAHPQPHRAGAGRTHPRRLPQAHQGAGQAVRLDGRGIRLRQAEENGRGRLLRGGAGFAGEGCGDRAHPLGAKGGRRQGSRVGRPVAFVGKGICFDTGGHNLKPAKYMQGMHEDMNGSAVVLGILAAASKLKLPVALEGWVALAENHISPQAYRQNEVITALNGTTIEVVHTDAEGRMVLADTLTLAARGKPDLIADFATLTGSMHHALGSRMSGVFASSSALAHQASRAGTSSGERIVVFPYPEDYDSSLDSTVADVKQCSMEGEADHILATRFLSRFVGDTPWLHMDLSGHSCKGGLGAVMSDTNGFGVAWGMALLDGLQA